jgi:formate-nitrite transporter family protein
LTRRNRETLVNVLRLWGVVLAANLAGAFLFGLVLAATPLFEAEIQHAFTTIGREALQAGFWTILLRGVFAGWLIALMVWLLPSAETARLWVIILITYIIGLGSFAHIIAGAVEMFYLALTGAAPWGTVVTGYLLPALLGNTLGGVSLVAVLNHAQVVSGAE